MLEDEIQTFVVQQLETQDPERSLALQVEVQALSLLSLSVLELQRRGREIERLQRLQAPGADADDEPPTTKDKAHRHRFDAGGVCRVDIGGGVMCCKVKAANGRPRSVATAAGEGSSS